VCKDWYDDFFFTLLVFENKSTFCGCVVFSGLCTLRRVVDLYGLVLDADLAVSALNTVHNHDTLAFACRMSQLRLFFKDEHAGFVIIQNRSSSASVLSDQPILGFDIEQLHKEVFVWLPHFVI